MINMVLESIKILHHVTYFQTIYYTFFIGCSGLKNLLDLSPKLDKMYFFFFACQENL